MKVIFAAAAVAFSFALAAPAQAEGLAEHTYLITWAADNCEGFEYAEDLLRHARMEVASAPEAEVNFHKTEVIMPLYAIYEDDIVEMCETVGFLIEFPEEDEE
ncbi:MAG: hypothetical protein GX970_09975 [Phyllobacteriaceae bacterium]|nr:hypothetical protein [Phyllobacteriaceae bacterium]